MKNWHDDKVRVWRVVDEHLSQSQVFVRFVLRRYPFVFWITVTFIDHKTISLKN